MDDVINEFGLEIIREVRDDSIAEIRLALDSPSRSWGSTIHASTSDPSGAKRAILALLPEIANVFLHSLLFAIESSERMRVLYASKDGHFIDVTDFDDELQRRMFGKTGWVAQFSEEPHGEVY